MVLALLFVLALIAMLLVAAHLSRHRRVRFSVAFWRLLSMDLEIDGRDQAVCDSAFAGGSGNTDRHSPGSSR